MRSLFFLAGLVALGFAGAMAADDKAAGKDNTPPPGFTALFNGKDLTGWKVQPGGKMEVWGAENGVLFVNGRGGLPSAPGYGAIVTRFLEDRSLARFPNVGVILSTADSWWQAWQQFFF